jgi:hypothetical protein
LFTRQRFSSTRTVAAALNSSAQASRHAPSRVSRGTAAGGSGAAAAAASPAAFRNSMRPSSKRTGSGDGSLAVTSTLATAGRVCAMLAPLPAQ